MSNQWEDTAISKDSPGVSLWAELKATLGDLTKTVQERNRQEAQRSVQPIYTRIHGSGIVPASGLLVLGFDLEGPTVGYYWHVKTLMVSGLTATTPVVGRADVFVQGGDFAAGMTNITQASAVGWRDQATVLPQFTSYGEGEMFLRYPEQLVVVVSGATPGQQIVSTATVQSVQDSAKTQGVRV